MLFFAKVLPVFFWPEYSIEVIYKLLYFSFVQSARFLDCVTSPELCASSFLSTLSCEMKTSVLGKCLLCLAATHSLLDLKKILFYLEFQIFTSTILHQLRSDKH